jgi:hypothetical protein
MGKPFFEASEGGLFEILDSWKDFALNKLQFPNGMGEMLPQKVRLEPSPNGLPMSVLKNF